MAMKKKRPEAPILPEERFTGTVTAAGKQFPIEFTLFIGPDCRLRFDVDPISPQDHTVLCGADGRPGLQAEEFSLESRSDSGRELASEHISLSGWSYDKDGYRITVSAREAVLKCPLETPVAKPALRLWFRGYRSFRNPPVKTRLGPLQVFGEAESVGSDALSGGVVIEAPTAEPGAEWREQADALLDHMHWGLTLAHGGRLQAPRVDYAEGSTEEVTFYDGVGFRSEFPVFERLHQQPFIQALAECYERNGGALPADLRKSLDWMRIETTYDELRFVTAMTALEALVNGNLPKSKRGGTIIPKTVFKKLRKALDEVLDASNVLADYEPMRERFKKRISEINRRPLNDKLQVLFEHHQIPADDFTGNEIRRMTAIRNEIIHYGEVPDTVKIDDRAEPVDIMANIILARELITRILLREIGFSGRYYCYIGGRHDRTLPPIV
ncbi:MAG: HEPN domain-containing protein [Pseudomonadota bacterium]